MSRSRQSDLPQAPASSPQAPASSPQARADLPHPPADDQEAVVAGVVVTLRRESVDQRPVDVASVRGRLRHLPGVVDVGECSGRRIPLVLEAGCSESMRDLHERLRQWDEVVQVDVVYVGFDRGSSTPHA